MSAALMSALLIVGSAYSASSGLHCRHEKAATECAVCSEDRPEVLEQVARLQNCSGWMARKKAARALRRYDWKCYPEAAEALAEALTNDDHCLVRLEAAESLAKMKPCLPSAHEAVYRAARCDTGMLTRMWAKKALKSIGKSCEASCDVCGPGSGPDLEPGLVREIPGALPGSPPLESTVDPLPPAMLEVPGSPSELSPFSPRVSPLAPVPNPAPRVPPARLPPNNEPALELPSLDGPRTSSTNRATPRTSSPRLTSTAFEQESERERMGSRSTRLPAFGHPGNLAGFLVGGDR